MYVHCPKSYWWNYKENLTPIKKSLALQIGDFTHIFHQKDVEGKLDKDFVDNLEQYIQKKYSDNSTDETLKVAYDSLNLYSGYKNKYKNSPFKTESPELNLELDYTDYTLYTRLDSLKRDLEGNLWRGEIKTASKMDSAYLSGLKDGLQAGISYIVTSNVLPERLKGTIYDIIVKTKVPQYERSLVLAEKNLVQRTLDCINGVVDGVLNNRFYPSMQCHYYNRECEYLPLCKKDTELTRSTFYTQRKEFYEEVKV
jgi:hypothetical protein